MRVLVIHHVNGSTRSAILEAPHVSRQMVDGGVYVKLCDAIGGQEIGDAMFTASGVVALTGVAIGQYWPAGDVPAQNGIEGGDA